MTFSKLLSRSLRCQRFLPLSFLRQFSFSSPEAAAVERRRRRRLLGFSLPSPLADIPYPPLPGQTPARKPQTNPSIPKLPEPSSSLSGPRLLLHNNILSLLRSGDLQEAVLLVRHSVYSNCRPTIHTVNAVLSALLDESFHTQLLTLYRFVNQAGIAPTILTHNILIQCHVDRSKFDLALDHYRFICCNLPLLPSRSTFRILVKALVGASRITEALQLKDEMLMAIEPDIEVYNLLMAGLIGDGDPDGALALYEELREKLDENSKAFGRILDGNLMLAYFKKGMEREALELYNSVLGEEGTQFRFGAQSYNSILNALCKNGKFEEALALFERMMAEHCPPKRVSVDLESFTLMVDGYCAKGRFKEAIDVFGKTGEMKCSADTFSYNNLIGQLGQNGMVAEAEELYREMNKYKITPNEHTFTLLMEACFGLNRMEDATQYLDKMEDSGIEPGTLAYNTVLCGLVKAGNLAEAMVYFDRMREKEVKRNLVSYEVLLHAFCEANRLDLVFLVVRALMMDDVVAFKPPMKELVEVTARREQMESELAKLYDEIEKEREDALTRAAEEKAREDALAREERLSKRAEAKAKQAATTRITKEHIELHIKRNLLSNNMERSQDAPLFGGISWDGVLSKKFSENDSSSNRFKGGNDDSTASGVGDKLTDDSPRGEGIEGGE